MSCAVTKLLALWLLSWICSFTPCVLGVGASTTSAQSSELRAQMSAHRSAQESKPEPSLLLLRPFQTNLPSRPLLADDGYDGEFMRALGHLPSRFLQEEDDHTVFQEASLQLVRKYPKTSSVVFFAGIYTILIGGAFLCLVVVWFSIKSYRRQAE